MKKWLRRILIAALLVGLTLGILYEYATHVGRGCLCGEAFYEGRPTSYWRSRIDSWKDIFATQDDALHDICPAAPGDAQLQFAMMKPRTTWEQVQDWFRWDEDSGGEFYLPDVLYCDPDAEPVLRELERDPAYRPYVERARRLAGGAEPIERIRVGR